MISYLVVTIEIVIKTEVYERVYQKEVKMPITPFIGMRLFLDTLEGAGDFLDAEVHSIYWSESDNVLTAVVEPTIKGDSSAFQYIAEDPLWDEFATIDKIS